MGDRRRVGDRRQGARRRATGEGHPPERLGWSFRDLRSLVERTGRTGLDDRVPKLAAALAYYTAFSVAPIVLIVIAIAGLLFGADAARGAVSEELAALVGQKTAQVIEEILKNAWRPGSGVIATVLGVLGVLFGAAGVFGELQDSLNIIWKVQKKPGRGLRGTVKDRFLSFGMVAGIGFLLLVSLVLSAGLEAAGRSILGSQAGALLEAVQQLVSLGVITLLFAFAFKVLPDARTRWKDVWVGALLTAVLFTAGKFLIGLYLGRSSVGSSFGAAGSLAVFLLWVYYSSQIFFFGAEFTKVYADTHGEPARPKPDAEPVRAGVPQG